MSPAERTCGADKLAPPRLALFLKRRPSAKQSAGAVAFAPCPHDLTAEKDDYETVGQKMYETHQGMSKLYEVSCEELDFLNDLASVSYTHLDVYKRQVKEYTPHAVVKS